MPPSPPPEFVPTGNLDALVASQLLEERILFLGTPVDDSISNRIASQMLLLAARDPHRDISLYINSPGGSVYAGMVVYDIMQLIPNDVVTVAMGMAASMAQFLLCSGTPGKRYSLPHARIMMHQPSGGVGGKAADVAIQARQMLYTKRMMQERIAAHTGRSIAQIAADSDRDMWLTPQEALAYGMIDKIVESATELRLGSAA